MGGARQVGGRTYTLVWTWMFGRTDVSQGGGGTVFFSAYVGSDPASTVHPPKISGISSNPKNI